MARLCTVCARGGSKGVKGKNLRPLGGKPLIVHTLEQARAAELFDLLAVSSDSEEILAVARAHGADLLVRRPPELATDTAGKVPAIGHALRSVEEETGRRFDVLVDLSATAPLREPADIVAAVRLLEGRGVSSVITGAEARCSPYFSMVERDEQGFVRIAKAPSRPVLRRQDAPACFDMNGSIYVWRRDAFVESPAVLYPDTLLHEMPPERSLDIDGPFDFLLAELLVAHRQGGGGAPEAARGA